MVLAGTIVSQTFGLLSGWLDRRHQRDIRQRERLEQLASAVSATIPWTKKAVVLSLRESELRTGRCLTADLSCEIAESSLQRRLDIPRSLSGCTLRPSRLDVFPKAKPDWVWGVRFQSTACGCHRRKAAPKFGQDVLWRRLAGFQASSPVVGSADSFLLLCCDIPRCRPRPSSERYGCHSQPCLECCS